MAIVSDRKMIYERKIAELQTQLTEVSGSERRPFLLSAVRESPPNPPALTNFTWGDHHVSSVTAWSWVWSWNVNSSLLPSANPPRNIWQTLLFAVLLSGTTSTPEKALDKQCFFLSLFRFSLNKKDVFLKFQSEINFFIEYNSCKICFAPSTV